MLDDKPLGAIRIPATIPADTLIIPVDLPQKQAESTMNEIRAAMAMAAPPKAAHEPIAVLQPQSVKPVGEVKMPKDEW